jgi:hypothetical protein
MNRIYHSSCKWLGVLLPAVVAQAAVAQTAPVSAAAKTPAKTPSSKVSTGVLNEWLRAQDEAFKSWDIGGQFRARFEVKDKAGSFPNRDFIKSTQDNDNSYLLLREKVHLGYTGCNWFNFYVEGRDSTTHGDDRNPNRESDQFDLHQAYVVLGNAKEFPVTLKVGRQEMTYGDERVIGVGDWGNLGRSFDAAKLRFENDSLWVDAFSGRVVMPDQFNLNGVNDYDWFSGVYASTKKLVPWQETQVYFLSRNANVQAGVADPGWLTTPPGARDIYTLGMRVKSLPGKLKGWDYTGEMVYQMGSINSLGKRLDQQAVALSLGGGYTLEETVGKPRLGLEYNYSSGDSDPTDGKSQTLDTLFPTAHKVYGYMDLIGWRNLHNPRFSVGIKPAKPVQVTLDYHAFWLADDRDFFYPESGAGRAANGYGRNSGLSKYVGSEVNLDVTYTVKSWLGFRTGFGHFFRGSYIEDSVRANGSQDADWVYLQTTLSF